MLLIDAAKRIHRGITSLQRRMAPAPAVLMELAASMWRPHALALVAELGIADMLANGPRGVAELAHETGTHEDSLYRVLRALAHDGILAQPSSRRFALTPLSQPLRSDHPQSVRNLMAMAKADYNQQSWARFRDVVRDGKPAFHSLHGRDVWSHFEDHPEDAALFHAAMAEITRISAPMIAAVYDFGRHRTLVDVGGGRAMLLSQLLSMFPGLRGVNYDLEAAVREAPRTLQEVGVEERCEIVTGSYFDRLPEGHDAYMLKNIVHGLGDDALDRLFANLRDSLEPGAVLILVEMLIPEDEAGTQPSFLDLQMLVQSGGRERTRSEYDALLAARGFRLREVKRTPSPLAVLVGERT